MKNVTMKDIADEIGISVVSVSNALSNRSGVSDSVRQKVIDTAEKLGYKYTSEKAAKDNEGNTIAVIIATRYATKFDSFYWNIYRKLSQKFLEEGYSSVLEMLSGDNEKELVMPSILSNTAIDGVIVLGQISEKYIHGMSELGKPLVLFDFYNKCSEYDTVSTDNFYSAYLITNYLISQGHREIGYVGDIMATSSILDRYLGYSRSMIESGLPLREEWRITDRDEQGYFVDLTLPENLPTAFVCNCDETAYNMIETLKAAGIRVPEDVSVTGYDDYIYSQISTPQITTVKVNSGKLIETCVDVMMKKIKNPGYTAGRCVVPGEMVIRDSVAEK